MGKKLIKVDRELKDLVSCYSWWVGTEGYLTTTIWCTKTKSSKKVRLHRFLMLFPKTNIDHKNGDKLDNRMCNLRLADKAQNGWNSKKRKNNTSGFKGVWWNAQRGRWVADIFVRGKKKRLGSFMTAKEAGAMYQEKAKQLHGEFYNPR